VVGVSQLTETYLRAIEEYAPNDVQVAGVLSERARQIGRQIGGHTVLAAAEAVRDIVDDLDTHGIVVERIVIACRLSDLSEAARQAIFALEAERVMDVHVLIEQFGLDRPNGATQAPEAAARFALEPERLALNSQRIYWRLKRAIDIVGSVVALLILAPVVAIVAGALAVSLGFPLLFWQQRPGLGARPFRLYKLRTMRPAYDSLGRRLSDEERTSWVGDLVRRTRLDEVPQLVNILFGDMSFIGPRPLLPRDQSPADQARLLVRPGLTGWAQVTGGRTISPDNKAALDVWYIQNASLLLDLRICLRTIPIVVFGERVNRDDIARAWEDLKAAGIARERPPTPLEDAA
jgi:lipopolysaccharide/colanic/teichoic acid biosynthesis glycosyltransferase